ncbi:BlaI/MecI/CopY family transcriptional regulator [Pseudoalteromonas sp. T1lg65]|uniref:BlaI/MecI/CopY family transcriptional regulator n=1 Tax=Pseudoalteromonas sp. T1lg65 TaxID=2077101 RepID=UPI003F79A674
MSKLKPNATELTILKLLWKREPRSARDIHDDLESFFSWGYSSTRKTLERMCDKGLLSETKQANKKIYTAEVAKLPTLALYAQEFVKQVLEVDGPVPVAMFSDSRLIDVEELDELEQALNDLEKQQQDKDTN